MKTCQWLKKAYSKMLILTTIILIGYAPTAMAQKPIWMLGDIAHKSAKDTTVVIVATKQPIVITSIKSNCSCLKAKINKRAAQIGDTIEISLKYNAKDKGFFFKKVELIGNGLTWNEIIVRGKVH